MSILRRFTNFVLQGRTQACATAFILAYIPVIGNISVLIAGLTTLRKGALSGAFVFLAATLPYLLSYFSATSETVLEINLAFIAVVIFAASNTVMWLFAVILRRYSSWGLIFDLAILLSVAIIGMIHFLYPDIENEWAIKLTDYFNKTAAMMREVRPNAAIIPADIQAQAVNVLKMYATGILIVSITFNAFLQLLLSRWWQAILFNPGELRKELLSIRLSYAAGALFLIGYSLASIGNKTAVDMMPMMYLVFSAAGLSVVHSLIAAKTRGLWLAALYLVLMGTITLFPGGIALAALILSLVAFFDIGINFRKRFAVEC
jgi:hypothetical protein